MPTPCTALAVRTQMHKEEATSTDGVIAQREAQAFGRAQRDRKELFPRAVLAGVLAGCAATAFRIALALGDQARDQVVGYAHRFPSFGWLIPGALGALLTGLAVYIVRRWAPETSGSGIPHLEAVLHGYRDLKWGRVLPIKFIGGVLAMSAGLVLGREGPTVQMGGAIGDAVARATKAESHEAINTLRASGAGAGLAAAFNAPLAGLVFVLEELQRDFRPRVFGAAFLAAASADAVARFFSGQLPVFKTPIFEAPRLVLLPGFVILGVVLGLLGVLFNVGLINTLNGYARLTRKWGLAPAIAMGAFVGVAAYFHRALVGGGHGIVEESLSGHYALTGLATIIIGRFILTLGSYGTGAPGGIFAPLLAIGATVGLAFGWIVQYYFPGSGVALGAFAAVGMAAFFASIVRAPLTGIVLILEMTASFSLMLPLLVACLAAYLVAEATQNLPIYEALLQRDLRLGGHSPEAPYDEPFQMTVEVKAGSKFDGMMLRQLGLPRGILLVGVSSGGKEQVPDADMILRPHMRISAVVSPEVEDGIRLLVEGCEPTE